MNAFCPDEDRRSELMELSEVAIVNHAKRGQLETAVEDDGDPARLLKWVGSKSRIADQIVTRFPRRCRDYYEPFCGSAAVFYQYRPWVTGDAFLTDANAELVGFFQAIKTRPAVVEARARWYADRHCQPWFYEVRGRFNDPATLQESAIGSAERAAMFLYLNRGAFNGLWRVNKKGHFNVPWNKSSCHVPSSSTMVAAWRALHRARIAVADFELTMALAGKDDVVYCDPPYVDTFSGYASGGFDEAQHMRLAHAIASAAHRGARVVLSNSDTLRTLQLYLTAPTFDGLRPHVDRVSVFHAVGAKASRRSTKAELLITYQKE